jgi:hypothetical protein
MVRLIEGIGLKEQQVLAGLFAGHLFYLPESGFICGFCVLFAGFQLYLQVSSYICKFAFLSFPHHHLLKKAPSTEVNEAFSSLSLAVDRIILPALLQFFFCINDAHRVSSDKAAGRDVLVDKGPGGDDRAVSYSDAGQKG